MISEFDKLIEEKKRKDLRQRQTTLALILFSITIIITIFYLVANKRKENKNLENTLKKTETILSKKDSITNNLLDTIDILKEKIDCTAKPLKQRMPNGDPLYIFTLKLKDSTLVNKVKRVDYYFNDLSFNPKLKSSIDKHNNYKFSYRGWGCMEIVNIYLHYKDNNKIDTIFFPMCDKTKIELPTQ